MPVLFSGSSGLLGAARSVRFRDGVRRCFANAFPPCSCCAYCSSPLRMVVIERPDLLLCSEIFVVAVVVVFFVFYLCLFQGEEVEAAGGGLLMIYVCC